MIRATTLVCSTMLLTSACHATQGFAAPDMEPADTVEQRTSEWMKGLGEGGYKVTIREQQSSRGLAPYCHFNSSIECASNLRSDLMIYTEGDTSLSLGFSTQLQPDTPLLDVQAALTYVALDRLPTPGLAARGWRISPSTPVSSIRKGVTVTGYDGKRIQLSVETEFYAVNGSATPRRCEAPADSSSLPGCTFQVRQPLAGHVTIDLPVFAQPWSTRPLSR